MGLDDALIFTRVVECHSFTQAATSLGMQKSTVSRRIALLEERLGVRLLNRTTRSISLTAEGELYLTNAQRLLGEIEEMERQVSSSRAEPKGLLRVNAPLGFGRTHISPAISSFVKRYP